MQGQQQIIKRPSTFPMFSKHLSLQPITSVDYANQCKKQFEDFNQAFKKRITIQLDYAKNLESVSKLLDKYIQPGTQKTMSFICSAFKVQNQQRANQAKQLAQSLRTQIYEICSTMQKDQANIVKKIQKDIKRYLKQFQSLENQLDKHYQNYQKISKDAQELLITKNFLKYTSQIPQQKKGKLISKTMDSIKEKKQYEKLYLTANRNYNEFVRQYNKSITEDLNQLETQIRQQLTLQADCLRKLIVCEVSMFKNIQYDLINISKQMQALDIQKDIDILIHDNINNKNNLIIQIQANNAKTIGSNINKDSIKQKQKPSQNRKSLNNSSDLISMKSNDEQNGNLCLKTKQSQIDKGMMAISLRYIQQEIFNSKLGNKKNKKFKDILEKRWKQLNEKREENNNKKDEQQNQVLKQQINQNKTQKEKNQQGKEEKQKQQSNKILQEEDLKSLFLQYIISVQFHKELIMDKKQDQIQQATNQIYENFIIITRYINQVWLGQNPTLIQSKKKNKNQSESSFLFIKKLFQSNHFYRIVAYMYIQNFRIHHCVMIQNTQRTKEIGKLINSLITKSSKQNDVFIIRGLLGLLFTYYWIENNNKKLLFFQATIYKNSVWKKQDFWDAAIYESTYEEMLNFGPQKGQSIAETVLRQKNTIFSQLASYCHYMIMLGIVSKSVRQIVGRYCRLYQMTDDQNTNLSKMITNTIKQYKQIAAIYTGNNTNNGKETKTQSNSQVKENVNS